MRSVSALLTLALLPLAVQGTACRPRQPKDKFCSIYVGIISNLHEDAIATTFCESLLSISTLTFIETATVTPSSSYDTVPFTITGSTVTSTAVSTELLSSEITVSSTVISTATTTTTVTSSTVEITCLNSAFTAGASSASSSASASVIQQKRRAYDKPAGIPANWPETALSKACSCLSIPTPSTTSTVTVSLAPDTISVTSTATYTPSVTVTSSSIEISISTSTYLSTSTTTVTETAYATATNIISNGVGYRRYNCPYNGDYPYTFTSSAFNPQANAEVLSSGSIASLSFSDWTTGGSVMTLSNGDTFDGTQAALVIQGFFVARETGTYRLSTLGSEIDNWGYLWTGDVAYADWNDDNTDFQGFWTGTGTYAVDITMNEGDAIPLTWLWANGGGPGQSYFLVTSPDGSSTTDTSSFVVQACGSDTFA